MRIRRVPPCGPRVVWRQRAAPCGCRQNRFTACPASTAKATFAGGCFWCVESDFDKIPGVISTTAGYTDGKTVDPSHEQVSSQMTGHAEAVQVVYDPSKVS